MILAFTKTNSVVQFLSVLLIFLFVLGITYFTTRFVGNYQKNSMTGSNIQVLETLRLSSTKYIQLVKIGNKCFAIAVSKDTITCLGEIEEETLSFKDNDANGSFKDILAKFKVKSKDDKDV